LGNARAADTKCDDYIFFKPGQLDLGKLLAPASDPESEMQKRDLAAVLEAQKTRTPAQIEQAVGDNALSIHRFADVLGTDPLGGSAPEAGRVLQARVQRFPHPGSDQQGCLGSAAALFVTALYACGYQYGANRAIAGVHFPSDLEAVRAAATVIAAGLMQNP
jgi:acid phosphatase (class A)